MKKLNKFFAVLVALAMMATLAVTSAFAADPVTTQETDPTKAYLVKYLEIDSGVTVPDKTFYFTFTPSADSSHAIAQPQTGDPVTVDIPAIPAASISTSEMTASGLTTDGNSQVGAKALSTILAGVTWPHAGEFQYIVKEAADANGTAFVNDDNWTYDTQSYVLHVYIKNGTAGPVLDKVTVENNDNTGAKENPGTQDPTNDDENDPTTEADKTNGFTFDNKYTKTNNPTIDPNDPDPSTGKYGAFGVAKTVTGNYADKGDVFPFTITLNNANTKNAPQVTAYIYTGDTKGEEVVLNLFGSTTFDLKDKQSLVIPNLPDGTTATVTERLTASTAADKGSYTPDIAVVDNGTANATASATGTKGNDVSMGAVVTINDNDEEANVADVTNTFDDNDVTPTGILMNNLPYIVLALVAIGGLVAYVVVRRRQADEA